MFYFLKVSRMSCHVVVNGISQCHGPSNSWAHYRRFCPFHITIHLSALSGTERKWFVWDVRETARHNTFGISTHGMRWERRGSRPLSDGCIYEKHFWVNEKFWRLYIELLMSFWRAFLKAFNENLIAKLFEYFSSFWQWMNFDSMFRWWSSDWVTGLDNPRNHRSGCELLRHKRSFLSLSSIFSSLEPSSKVIYINFISAFFSLTEHKTFRPSI